MDPEVVKRLKELLAIDHDEIGPWSIREMQNLAHALLADWERVKLLLGKAAQEIHCAGPVDHRIRVLRREHAALVERLTRERDEARADWERRGEALRILGPEVEADPDECRRCNRLMLTRDGEEPTQECDRCAHEILREARAALEGGKP